ncbi:glycosyltransferase [Agrobacterium sp. CNPSo 3708]|uniref:glycosyltransferase n=1 Tax=Agrobacterium sp. CNPSo 3708 TaxID=3028150 RepID=UPI002363413F|nr:glycosyltransferase [Agrobacterium sp. CNPSo 3708]MDD1498792.1 glycosyltransferase [Agrobacterium sp. CNPSo 3708]
MTTRQIDEHQDKFTWTRHWFPDGQNLAALDRSKAAAESAGVSLNEVAETPCLVLLGDPGMGKTHEIEGLAEWLERKGEQVDLLRARDAEFSAKLDMLITSEHQRCWAIDKRPWHILIDGIDEIAGPPSSHEQLLSHFIDQIFASSGKSALVRIALTCRTGGWTEDLDRLVEQRWPIGKFKKLKLAPLEKEDILAAIERTEPQVAKREILSQLLLSEQWQEWASSPLLLSLLLRSHLGNELLPARKGDLFEHVVESSLVGPTAVPPEARVVVAGRLAVTTTFSGITRFTPSLGGVASDVFSVARIAGGHEPSTAGSVIATHTLLAEILRTPLFVEVEPGVFEWTHRTFVDYLTARYLADHRLSADQILSLLNVPEIGGPGGVAPQVVEVAGWAAAMVAPFFDMLLEQQPDILLRSKAAILDPADRHRVTAAILTRFAQGDLLDQYDQLIPLFGSLRHPRLAEQLRPVIAGTFTPRFERRAAIDIATETHEITLTPELLEVAGDPNADGQIRSIAARAISRLNGEDAPQLLAPILASDLESDTEDRLRGILLSVCWPSTLPFQQLLRALTVPRKPNFFGAYQLFLHRFVQPDLTSRQALDAIAWLQRLLDIDRREVDRLQPIAVKLFRAIIAQIGDAEVRKAFAAFVLDADLKISHFITNDSVTRLPWPDDSAVRSALTMQILRQAGDPSRAAAMLLHWFTGLVRTADLDAYLSIVQTASSDLRGPLSQIIADLTESLPIDTLARVWEVASHVPMLQRALATRYSIELGSTNAEYVRKSAERRRESQEVEEQETNARISWRSSVVDLLDRIEAGEAALWWQLNHELFYGSNDGYDENLEFETDLTTTPGWQALNDAERERIQCTAPVYLRDAPLTDLSWLGTSTSHRPANAGLRALRLLRDNDVSTFDGLSAETWAIWAPAVLGFVGNDFHTDGDPQRDLSRVAYRVAPQAVLAAVKRIAVGPGSKGLTVRVLQLLEGLLDKPLSELLHELRDAKDLKGNDAASEIVAYLVRNGDSLAVQQIQNALTTSHADQKSSKIEHPQIEKGVIELLSKNPAQTWLDLLTLREIDEELARSIWAKFAEELSFDRSFDFGALPEYALAQAYIDLVTLLPERTPTVSGARILGVPDYIEQLRSTLLSRLVDAGTNGALEQLHRMRDTLPELDDILDWSIKQARNVVRANATWREDPGEILARIGYMGAPTEPLAATPPSAKTDDVSDVSIGMDLPVPSPVPSGPLSIAQRRVILAVATEWYSHHGGISTLNRELCISLAALGHTVLCLVPTASDAEVLHAKADGVELIRCPASVQLEESARFLLCDACHLRTMPDFLIGHDHITGPAARALANRFDARYVHFLHTIPHENEALKTPHGDALFDPLRGEAKLEDQIALAELADLVVAVGPRIKRSFIWRAPLPNMTMLLPGLSPELLKLSPAPQNLQVNACLMSGRMEDAGVKGGLLACDVIKKVANDRHWDSAQTPKLVMRGFTKEKALAEFKNIGEFKEYSQFVQLRSFSAEIAKIVQDYRTSALIIMPSVAEGFGLTGLEAISAGVPTIISAESGLAEYLCDPALNQGLDPNLFKPSVAPVARSHEENINAWAVSVEAVLSNHPAAFARAAKLREELGIRLTWDKAARSLTNDFLKL